MQRTLTKANKLFWQYGYAEVRDKCVFTKLNKYFGQQNLYFVNSYFYFCPCKNSTCAPTANSWSMAPTTRAFTQDLNFTTDWNPDKSGWMTI